MLAGTVGLAIVPARIKHIAFANAAHLKRTVSSRVVRVLDSELLGHLSLSRSGKVTLTRYKRIVNN